MEEEERISAPSNSIHNSFEEAYFYAKRPWHSKWLWHIKREELYNASDSHQASPRKIKRR
jgi:hypothetical protein